MTMRTRRILLWILISSMGIAQAEQADEMNANLKSFLEEAMHNFLPWLKANPHLLPVNTDQFPFKLEGSRYNITGSFWNQSLELQWLNWSRENVTDVSFEHGTFFIFQWLDIDFSGRFEIDGDYLTEFGARGSVKTHGEFTAGSEPTSRLMVEGFLVNSDGYIDLSEAEISYLLDMKVEYIEGSAEDEVDYSPVFDALTCMLDSEGGIRTTFPIREIVITYLNEVFANTPVDDMQKNSQNAKVETLIEEKQDDPDDILYAVLNNTMSNFWDWVLIKNLDPTPVNSEQFLFYLEGREMNITARFWNQFSRGHAIYKGLHDVDDVNVADRSFRIDLQQERIMLVGIYALEGIYENETVFGSTGQFFALPRYASETKVIVDGFQITPDGYLDMSTANISYAQTFPYTEGYEFILGKINDDISDANIREEVRKAVSCVYNNQMDFASVFPIGRYIANYLTEYFNDHPIPDLNWVISNSAS